MKRQEQIAVRLSREEKQMLDRLAREQEKTPSEFVRALILGELGRLLVNVEKNREN